jgi:hypothetical protein
MNRGSFKSNYDLHNIQTRQKVDMHMPLSKLTLFKKGAHNSGSEIFNRLLSFIKELSNDVKSFKIALKNFLMANSFYTLGEFFKGQSLV